MRFASLGSGSEGNGLLVQVDGTCVLADCGFKLPDAVARLARCGIEPARIAALLITHEHDDHIGGAASFAREFMRSAGSSMARTTVYS